MLLVVMVFITATGTHAGTYLEILDIFGAAKLGQTCGTHQGKEMEEEQPMAPQDGVGAFTVAAEPAGEERVRSWVLTITPGPRPVFTLSPEPPLR